MPTYAVTFRLVIPKPRGKDLEITVQVKGIVADSPDKAMRKAYARLSPEQQEQVQGVYMKRTDEEG